MEIKLKYGIDNLLFGMKEQDVTKILGKPDTQYKDEEEKAQKKPAKEHAPIKETERMHTEAALNETPMHTTQADQIIEEDV